MRAITLPRRRLWGNRHGPVRPPGPLSDLRCSSPRAPLSTKPGLVHKRERAVGPIRGALHRRRRRGGVFDVVVPPRGLWRAHPLGSGGQTPLPCPDRGRPSALCAYNGLRTTHLPGVASGHPPPDVLQARDGKVRPDGYRHLEIRVWMEGAS
jgi:hypothetical protein